MTDDADADGFVFAGELADPDLIVLDAENATRLDALRSRYAFASTPRRLSSSYAGASVMPSQSRLDNIVWMPTSVKDPLVLIVSDSLSPWRAKGTLHRIAARLDSTSMSKS